MSDNNQSNRPKVKPVGRLRLWPLSAAIWRQKGQHGFFYNATFQRSYKKEDGTYENSESIGRDDLLLLAKLADRVHSAILLLEKKDRDADRAATEGKPGAQGDAEDDVPF